MAKPRELPWHDLPPYAKRKVLALLAGESEKHPQGHYGAAVRAAIARLPETPRGKLPPRRTSKGKELSAMLRVDATRERGFKMIVGAVREKGSILQGARHLGIHKWTLFMYLKQYPSLGKRVRAANAANRKGRIESAATARQRQAFAAERQGA